VAALRAAVAYDEVARKFLLRVKIGARRELVTPLGLRLAATLRAERFAARCDLIVPVPSHRWTDLRRGFSPSRELARVVGRNLGIPVRTEWLRRRLWGGRPSKKLGIKARTSPERDPFHSPLRLPGWRVLLVDDVLTTGASVERCARLLLARGASEVRAAVWARTLPRNGHTRWGKIA
jgi:predicted amidophosphoribosyltransferase